MVSHYLQDLELTPLPTAQHWSKTIQKAFKERHPDNLKVGGDTKPATPSKAGAGPRAPKTPASGKGRKRTALDDDEDTSPHSGPNSNSIANKKTPRTSAKRVKYSEDSGEDDKEKQAVVKGETGDDI